MRTRSKTKKIRENVRRLPHEVEATLSSWVKCTDPIPREILEEVRSTVTTWMKNVRNYVEETETYILNDEHTPQEIVDEGWAFFRIYCPDPYIYSSYIHSYAEGVGRFATSSDDLTSAGEESEEYDAAHRRVVVGVASRSRRRPFVTAPLSENGPRCCRAQLSRQVD